MASCRTARPIDSGSCAAPVPGDFHIPFVLLVTDSREPLEVAAARAPRVDADDALLVVKHVLPDAFTHQDPALGTPTIVLTAEGQVIQAGWVKTEAGRAIATTLTSSSCLEWR